ncbi:MAG: orotidine-5'-phosphate decarboxylase [Chloroflexota bacterium]
MTSAYLERLAARTAATGTVLCVGLDPEAGALPEGFSRDLAGVEAFARVLLEAALPHAAAVKPNLAFFEAYGSDGIAALERLRALVPAEVPFVADAKRGDIGSTAARQAAALYDGLGADAITVNPYLGEEAVLPLIERADRYAYVLCRTSNPGAGELQGLSVAPDEAAGYASEPLYARVARRAATWGPAGPWAWLSAPRRRRSWPRSARSCQAWASSCRASALRAARWRRCWPRGRQRGLRPVGDPAAGSSSTSRAASRGPRSKPLARGCRMTSGSGLPPLPESGPRPSLCYPEPALDPVPGAPE